jgi:hypothetical protein
MAPRWPRAVAWDPSGVGELDGGGAVWVVAGVVGDAGVLDGQHGP